MLDVDVSASSELSTAALDAAPSELSTATLDACVARKDLVDRIDADITGSVRVVDVADGMDCNDCNNDSDGGNSADITGLNKVVDVGDVVDFTELNNDEVEPGVDSGELTGQWPMLTLLVRTSENATATWMLSEWISKTLTYSRIPLAL
eukprot:4716413-Amphidinium_carterae.1